MADYTPGKMDITTQEKTFEAFIKWVTRGTIFCIAALIFLALVNA